MRLATEALWSVKFPPAGLLPSRLPRNSFWGFELNAMLARELLLRFLQQV
jgi:hypothetical protein